MVMTIALCEIILFLHGRNNVYVLARIALSTFLPVNIDSKCFLSQMAVTCMNP